MNYILIGCILLFAGVAQLASKIGLGPVWAAVIAILGTTLLKYGQQALVMGWGAVAGWHNLVIIIIQLILAVVVMVKAQQNDDTIGLWLLWVVVGAGVIFMLVPEISRYLPI